MSSASFLKRLERLEQAIRVNRPRLIVLATDGNSEDREAVAELLQSLKATAEDLIVSIRQFASDLEDDLPRVISIN